MSEVKSLKLERPMISFDLETTGLDVREDRIVELSCIKILPSGEREVRTKRLNPQKPISPAASAVHGIYDDDVKDEPTFSQIAKSLLDFMAGCDLTGYNIERFDLPLLVREFKRVDIEFPPEPVGVIDSYRIYLNEEPRDLTSAYKYFCNKDLIGAHGAQADAEAAADILLAQVARYENLPADVQDLHAYCHPEHPDWLDPDGKIVWVGDQAVLGFGKNKGQSLKELARSNPGYLEWIATSDFSDEVKRIILDALQGKYPEPPTQGS